MNKLKKKLESFLKKYDMHAESVDLNKCVEDFLGEMKKGLAGNSSIAMIPTYLEIDNPIPPFKKVVAIDAGGTNLRTALVSFDENYKAQIEDFKKYPMPGTGGAVSKDEFFDTLADYVVNLVPQVDKIGFCFSYPTEMFPNKDGKLIKFSKEVESPEVHGEMIGENLLSYLRKKGITEEKEIVILNDTVATLLTGMISFPDHVFSAYVGFIFGTGINSSYVESNKNIKKLKGMDQSHNQVINTECGSFGLPPRGIIDKELDSGTADPGHYYLEKMVSGGYFGLVVSKTLEKAVQDGLFSAETNERLSNLGRLSTKDADDYLHNPHNKENALVKALKNSPFEDKEMLFYLIDNLLDRASRLTACAMAGILLKSGAGTSALEPVCLTVDGTTFYLFYQFRTRVETYLREILKGDWQRYYDIVRVEDAPLLGAAIAALTN